MAAKRIAKPRSKDGPDVDDKFADQVIRGLRRAPVSLTKKQLFEIDRAFTHQPQGVGRRIGLGVYTLSGKRLLKLIETDRQAAVAFAEAATCIEGSAEAHRTMGEELKGAAARIRVGLCVREDMDAVLKEAAHG